MSTVRPASQSSLMSGKTPGWSRGSPPVTSTRGVSNGRAFSSTSARRMRVPPLKACVVSHHEQRRLQPVVRTKVHGTPAKVDSPWMLA